MRLDNLHFQNGEVFFENDNATVIVAGIRYNVNYLTAIKWEFQHKHTSESGDQNRLTMQVAIGF